MRTAKRTDDRGKRREDIEEALSKVQLQLLVGRMGDVEVEWRVSQSLLCEIMMMMMRPS